MLDGGSAEELKALATAFDDALAGSGFCLLVGYESILPEAAIDALRAASHTFFAAPPDAKARSYVDGMVGYLGPGAENVAASSGFPSRRPDPVESLNLPAYQEEGLPWSARAAADAAKGSCPWRDATYLPRDDVARGFADAAAAYFAGATALMLRLMSLSELALGLPDGYFSPSFGRPGTLLRVAYYPPPEEGAEAEAEAAEEAAAVAEGEAAADAGAAASGEDRLRYGAHTDVSGLRMARTLSLSLSRLGLRAACMPPFEPATRAHAPVSSPHRLASPYRYRCPPPLIPVAVRWLHHPPTRQRRRRPRDPDGGWRVAARALAATNPHHQHRRPARAVDQRPLEGDDAPGGRASHISGGGVGAALDCVLHGTSA